MPVWWKGRHNGLKIHRYEKYRTSSSLVTGILKGLNPEIATNILGGVSCSTESNKRSLCVIGEFIQIYLRKLLTFLLCFFKSKKHST